MKRDAKLGAEVRRRLQLAIPAMDLNKIISELQAEKNRLDEAIQALERLSAVGNKTKRRGRPPRWLTAKGAEPAKATNGSKEENDYSASDR